MSLAFPQTPFGTTSRFIVADDVPVCYWWWMPDAPREVSIALLKKVAAGDRQAFSRFYDLFVPFVFSFALRLLRNRADAEDLTQEVFVQVWNQAGRYAPERGNPEAWISTMTKNRAIDRMRSLRSRERGVEALGRDSISLEAEAADRDGAKSDARLLARTALETVPVEERKLLEMAYFDGLTQTEIAEKTGVPLGTVKTRLRTGLKRLRDYVATAPEERKTHAAR